MPVCEPLAFRALHGRESPVLIVEAERDPVVVAELVFRKVAVQVLLSAVLVKAFHSALENGEYAFDRVAVNVAAHVLAM